MELATRTVKEHVKYICTFDKAQKRRIQYDNGAYENNVIRRYMTVNLLAARLHFHSRTMMIATTVRAHTAVVLLLIPQPAPSNLHIRMRMSGRANTQPTTMSITHTTCMQPTHDPLTRLVLRRLVRVNTARHTMDASGVTTTYGCAALTIGHVPCVEVLHAMGVGLSGLLVR